MPFNLDLRTALITAAFLLFVLPFVLGKIAGRKRAA